MILSASRRKRIFSASAPIFAWLGVQNGFGVVDGKITPDLMTPEFLDALKFIKRLYDEKLINQDFAVTEDARQFLQQGSAGAVIMTIENAVMSFQDLFKLDPKAELDVATRFEGPRGMHTVANSGFYGLFVMAKSSVKSEDEIKKVLSFFDRDR